MDAAGAVNRPTQSHPVLMANLVGQLAFGLLAIVGGRMIWESFAHDEEKSDRKDPSRGLTLGARLENWPPQGLDKR